MHVLTKVFCGVAMVGIGLATSGCFEKKITCSDETGIASLTEMITEEIEKDIKKEHSNFSLPSIRAAVATVGMSVQSIRTSKEDPNSTRVFCEAELVISVPATTISDANTAIETAKTYEGDVDSLLGDYNYKLSRDAANNYTTTVVYNIQPTDDKKEIFTQIEDGSSAIKGISSLLGWSMSKTDILKQVAEEERLQKEEEARIAREEKERINAENAVLNANLARAKASYKNAVGRINEIWNGLDPELRDELRPEQKAINNHRESYCKAESLGVEGNNQERETYRLECEVDMLNQRSNELLNYY